MAKAKKILIIDDDPAIARLAGMNLEHAGYSTFTAFDARDGLRKVLTEKPDLIMLDIEMPYADGFAIMDIFKSSPDTAGIPIIMCSARSDIESVSRGIVEGAEFYLTKPFNPVELVALVDRLLKPAPAE